MAKQKRYSKKAQGELLAAYKTSGLGPLAFCKQAGVAYSTFKHWQARFKKSGTPWCEFYTVHPKASVTATNKAIPMLRIMHPTGCTFEISEQLPLSQLAQLLGCLGMSSCSVSTKR